MIKATASEFIGKSTIVGKTVAIIQANPIPVVAAIILIAALIIGYKCHKSYSSFKSQLAEKDQKIKDITGNLNGTEKALDEKSRELLKTEKRLKETEKNAETLKAESARLNNIKINEASELNKNLQAKVENFVSKLLEKEKELIDIQKKLNATEVDVRNITKQFHD